MSNVNVYTDSLNIIGTTPSQARYEQNITIQWTDENGKSQEASETAKWPDILDDLDPELIEEVMQDLLIKSLRSKAGVDKPRSIEV